MQVFVLDTNRKPLDPCSPARARILLAKGRAAVFRAYPFTILLKDRKVEDSVVHEHRVKIDPSSTNGKHRGNHTGRVALRFGQNFQIGAVSVHPRHCKAVHRADGYAYAFGETIGIDPRTVRICSSPRVNPGVFTNPGVSV
jgi:RRXRR protein